MPSPIVKVASLKRIVSDIREQAIGNHTKEGALVLHSIADAFAREVSRLKADPRRIETKGVIAQKPSTERSRKNQSVEIAEQQEKLDTGHPATSTFSQISQNKAKLTYEPKSMKCELSA